MNKKLYIAPWTESVATDAEELLAGSIEVDENGGTGELIDTEVDTEGMSRLLIFSLIDE